MAMTGWLPFSPTAKSVWLGWTWHDRRAVARESSITKTFGTKVRLVAYRYGSDPAPSKGPQVCLLLGGNVKQLHIVARSKEQYIFAKHQKVAAFVALITKGVTFQRKKQGKKSKVKVKDGEGWL